MDPVSDVGLSLGASTRDRHAYAANNPIGYVDPNGHEVCVTILGHKVCTKLDEKIAAVVDTTVKAVRGDTSPTPVRSILPTGSVGPISVTTPSVVNISSQLTPYPGVPENDRLTALNFNQQHGQQAGQGRQGLGSGFSGSGMNGPADVSRGKSSLKPPRNLEPPRGPSSDDSGNWWNGPDTPNQPKPWDGPNLRIEKPSRWQIAAAGGAAGAGAGFVWCSPAEVAPGVGTIGHGGCVAGGAVVGFVGGFIVGG